MSHRYSLALKLTSKSVQVHNFIFLTCISLPCIKLQISLTTLFINSLTKLISTSLKISKTSFATGSSSLLLLQDLPAAAQDHLSHLPEELLQALSGCSAGTLCPQGVTVPKETQPHDLQLLRWRPLGAYCYIKHISDFFRFFFLKFQNDELVFTKYEQPMLNLKD